MEGEVCGPADVSPDLCCVSVLFRLLNEHGYLIEGYTILPMKKVNERIPYKYWISCGEGEFEVIYKKPMVDIVNRCLYVDRELVNNGGELFLSASACCAVLWPSASTKGNSSVWSWAFNGSAGTPANS